MASESDETWETLIEDLRPRLRKLVVAERVLDHIHFIEAEKKEQIRQKAKSESNAAAVELLVTAVLQRPHSLGWFTAFVDALQNAGCEYAADCVQVNLPDPEVEAENDYCVRLIQLLSPSLVTMKTADVCDQCYSAGLFSSEDSEIIKAETTNKGSICGARELLRSIVRGRPGWFSKFLRILQDTEHQYLYELTGGSPHCDKPGSPEKLPSPKDEPKGSEVVTEESPAAAESCDISMTEDPESTAAAAAAARGPENADIVLRDYQMDVARPALEGKNIIICLPTGSGKTRVAVYITKKHLDHRRAEGQSGKVVVLVNKVPLVEQHYAAEFLPFLKQNYKVERVSGDCQLKISFTEIVKKNDVIICTAQILENYLERSNTGEDEGVNLSDLTLIVIDECHHTQKGGVYNHIMMRYLKQKHKNTRLKKEQKEPVSLPQILGLTASPGVGGATKMEKAVEHILQICANLDASRIMTGSLGEYKKEPRKKTLTVEDRKEAEGRGRAGDSTYTLVEVKNSGVAGKEYVNEYRKDMMHKAIDKIKTLIQADYDKQILEFQMQAILEEKVRITKKKHKDMRTEKPSDVRFSCRGCSLFACTGEDIQIIANVHRVNVTSEFSELFNRTENTSLQERLLDGETSGFIACKNCGQRWGSMMVYRGIECPCLHVKNFVVTCNGKKIGKCARWNELAVKFSPFDYAEHAKRVAESSDDEETT